MLVGDHACKPELTSVARIQTDDARCRLDQLVHHLAPSSSGPVRLARQVSVHRLPIDPNRIVVELVLVRDEAFHAVILADYAETPAASDPKTFAITSTG